MNQLRGLLAAGVFAAFAIGGPAPASAAQAGFCTPTQLSGLSSNITSAMSGISGLLVSVDAVNASLRAGVAGSTHSDIPAPTLSQPFQTWTASSGVQHDLSLLQQAEQMQQEACSAQNAALSVTQGSPSMSSWSQLGTSAQLLTSMQNNSPQQAPQAMMTYVYQDAFNEPSLLAAQNAELANPAGTTEAMQALGSIETDAVAALQTQNMMEASKQAATVTDSLQGAANLRTGFDTVSDPSSGWSI